MRRTFFSSFLIILSAALCAEQMPDGYYNAINGLSDAALKTALSQVIRRHTVLSYGNGTGSSWECFYYSDRNEAGLCMDMYCDDWRPFTAPGAVVSGCNVEHSFAKSWWGGAKNDAYKDCYHLNPSNATANSSRGNYPMGVPTSDLKSNSGSLRVGKATYNGQTFWVFEPKDEYKGDFARAYFYMATCYGEELTWRKDNTDVGSYYAMRTADDPDAYLEFLDWEIDILLQWHRQDPVSTKELNRADAVSNFQHNRNPFIDYPCLAEYIWGNRKGQAVQMASLKNTYDSDWLTFSDQSGCACLYSSPTLIAPSASPVSMVSPTKFEAVEHQFTVRAAVLSEALSLSLSGADAAEFSLSVSSIDTATAHAGTLVTLTYCPSSYGTHHATLTIANSEVSRSITVEGTCDCVFTALPARNISATGFTARWTDAEVADYQLDVYRKSVSYGGVDTLLYIPQVTKSELSDANCSTAGNIFEDSNGFRLGTGSGDGSITLPELEIGSGASLIIRAKAYGSDKSYLAVKADGVTIASQPLTTTLSDYTFSIPEGAETITILQGVTKARVIITAIRFEQTGMTTDCISLSGYPRSVGAVTSYDVLLSADEAAFLSEGSLFYHVTPLAGTVSHEIEVSLTPTAIDLPASHSREARKVMSGGRIFIIVDGHTYDILGRPAAF